MKLQRKIVVRNDSGSIIFESPIKMNETASDRLVNLLLNKDIIIIEGDSITVEKDVVEDEKIR